MKDHDPASHPYFLLLLVWRGLLAALALHAVVDKPFEAMLLAVAVIGCFALFGEFVYARKVAWDAERRRLARERELREQRAEEARQRFAAAQEAAAKARRGFGLDDDEPAVSEPVPASADTAVSPFAAMPEARAQERKRA